MTSASLAASPPTRVLVADDDESIVNMLRSLLRAWGYEPVVARDGESALAMLRAEGAPRAAILDWMMPGRSGLEVIHALGEVASSGGRRGTCALLLTAKGSAGDLAEALAAGAHDYVAKPFDPVVLRARLAAMLRHHDVRPERTLDVGAIIDGRYRLEAPLGAGGMGSVYRATHLALGRSVALKVVRADVARTPGSRERFEREARAAAAIESPHVARVLDFGVTSDGHSFLVMEHLEGQTLEQRLERLGALDVGEAVRMVDGLAEGLTAAHRLGVIHRDITPANVFLAEREGGSPVPKLIDFGLARLFGKTHATDTFEDGEITGTIGYMSPGQLLGEGPSIDGDLWALAATAVAALTGRSPFEEEIPSMTVQRTLEGPPPQLSLWRAGLPRELDAWAESAFSRDAALRFGSPGELAYAFSVAASRARHFRPAPIRPTP